LAIETADGVIQYRIMHSAGTIDNGDGTHDVQVTEPFTATTQGSSIVKVSYLELVRFASDKIVLNYDQDGSVIEFPIRTIITPTVSTTLEPLASVAYSFGARPFGLRTFGPNPPVEQLNVRGFGQRVFGLKTFGSV
jgi:hypothetical protein